MINKIHSNTYTIKLKSAGALRIGAFNSPKNKNIIYLPVQNYYTSSYVRYLAVTPTGSSPSDWIEVGDFYFDTSGGRLNGWGTW
ncbi:hypothetical protein [Spirosoma koreense]